VNKPPPVDCQDCLDILLQYYRLRVLPWDGVPIAVVVSIAAAAIIYYGFERPLQQWLRRGGGGGNKKTRAVLKVMGEGGVGVKNEGGGKGMDDGKQPPEAMVAPA